MRLYATDIPALCCFGALTAMGQDKIMHPSYLSVSVIIPVYNGGNDFQRCLKALAASVNSGADGDFHHDNLNDGGAKPRSSRATAYAIAAHRLASQSYATHQQSDSQAGATLSDARKMAPVSPLASGFVGNRPVEIIVVSDGDSDGSWRLAEAFGARLIRLPQSGGPAKARNIGAKAASGDILFFVDADVEVHLDAIAKVAESFEANPDLDALIGSYDDAPGAPNFLSQYKNLIHHYTHQEAGLEASTFWGACGAVRRHVFEEVGGFDESYRRPCIEDIELGYRLKYAGHQIHLRSDIQVKHLKRWTPFSLLRADIFYRALPWMNLLMQVQQSRPAFYRRFTQELNLKWSSKASVILVFGLLLSGLGATLASVGLASFASWPLAGWVAALLCGIGLLLINLPVYRFFYTKHGWLFALKTVPWHWLYFFYSGVVYAYTNVSYRLRPG